MTHNKELQNKLRNCLKQGARLTQSVEQQATGWITRMQFLVGARDLSLHHQNQLWNTFSLLFNGYHGLVPWW
jgi:hypothetical protein